MSSTLCLCDVICCNLKIRPIFGEMKKLAMKRHRSISSVRNLALNALCHYDARVGRGLKCPLAIITWDENFVPCSKTSRRNPFRVSSKLRIPLIKYISLRVKEIFI